MKRSTLKKLMAGLIAATLTFGMSTAAFAADQNVTITSETGSAYAAYQVFTSVEKDAGNDETVFQYTVTDAFAGFFAEGANGYVLDDDGVIYKGSVAEANVIATDGFTNTNATDAAALAAALEKYAIDNGIASTTINVNEAAALATGLWVIRETANTEGGAIASKPMLADVRDEAVNITAKDDKITLDKEIEEDDKQKKTNDAAIGDVIEYSAATQVPTYEANVDTASLKYVLTDTFSTGITYNSDVEVTIGETTYKAGENEGVVITNSADGFTVSLSPAMIVASQGLDVTLAYTGTLNENAKINTAIPNDIELEYTNNPNKEDDFNTLEDETKTYTYGFQIHKVDANDITEDLAGAEFVIKDEDGNEIAVVTYNADGTPVVDAAGSEDVKIVTGEDGLVTVTGLDEGTYKIEEKVAPEGYSLIGEDIVIVIDAVEEVDDNGETVLDKNGNEVKTGEATYTVSGGASGEDVVTDTKVDDTTGLTINCVVLVKDYKGISLPETGSKSAMYCMIGGALIILIGALYYEFAVRRARK